MVTRSVLGIAGLACVFGALGTPAYETLPSFFVPYTCESGPCFAARVRNMYVVAGREHVSFTAGENIIAFRLEGAVIVAPAGEEQDGTVNRFTAADWRQDIPAFRSLRYPEVFPGIDLKLTVAGSTFKSEYIVAPYADPSHIRFRYDNAVVTLENGSLQARTGSMTLEEPPPFVYQDTPAGRRVIESAYKLTSSRSVTFALGAYDPALPLVIDPYVIASTSTLGGARSDRVTSIASDAAGNLYLAGWTESIDFPAGGILGAASGVDAFVIKLNSAATQVLFATRIGGSGFDQASDIAVKADGSTCISGFTTSTDFPVASALNPAFRGGVRDGFITCLNPAGNGLVFSTYIGGSGEDNLKGIAFSPSGALWAVGNTTSFDIDIARAVQLLHGGMRDAYLVQLSPAGELVSGTYLGGLDDDDANAVAVDASGNIYVTGGTNSPNFPTQNSRPPGGAQDAFVAKLDPTGESLIYSTFLGGSGGADAATSEFGTQIAVNSAGEAVVAGVTSSTDFPVTGTQSTFGGGNTDAFVARFSAAGVLLAARFIGNESTDEAHAVAIAGDHVYIGGHTAGSTDFDGFVAKLTTGLDMVESVYLTGTFSDVVTGLAVQESSIIAVGYTASPDFATATEFHGDHDVFIVKLDAALNVTIMTSPDPLQVTVAGANCSPGAYTAPVTMAWKAGSPCVVSFPSIISAGPGKRYVFSQWQDGVTATSRTLSANASGAQYTGIFKTQYTGSSSVNPVGSGTVAVAPDGFHDAGSTVQVAAAPLPGYRFSHWTGDLSGSTPTQNLTLTSPWQIVANFACVYSVEVSAQAIGMSGGVITATVSTGAGCYWTAQSNAAWIEVSQISGQGSATLTLSVSPTTVARSAVVTIAGRTFSIAQTFCAFAVTLPAQNAGPASAILPAVVSTDAGCMWTAHSNVAWLLPSTNAGSGSGTVAFSMAANSGGQRTGMITVAGRNFTITQRAYDPAVRSYITLDSVQPFAGYATEQTFTVVYGNKAGWNDIGNAYLVFNQSTATARACYIQYNPAAMQIRLYDDAGTGLIGPAALGAPGGVENSQCRINTAASSFTASGEKVTLHVVVSFKPGFTGHKRIFMAAENRVGETASLWLCLGGWWPGVTPGVPVNRYRLFNPFSRSHLHTTDLNEYNVLGGRGFHQEGVSGKVYNTPGAAGGVAAVPLYRIYNEPGLRHFWTADRNEYVSLINWFPDIYKGEGIDGFVFESHVPGSVPLYRLVFEYDVIHHWTTDSNEYGVLGASGHWRQEGVAAYLFPP